MGIVLFLLSFLMMSSVVNAGPLYDKLLKKEAAYATCGKAMEKETRDYLKGKLSGMNRCQEAEECIWLPMGGGQIVSESAYLKFNHCYLRVQRPEEFCEAVFENQTFSCKSDLDLPCYRDPEPTVEPTHFTCVKNQCVPHFDGKKREWYRENYRLYKKNSKEDPKCKRDLKDFYKRMSKKYLPAKGLQK